MLKPLITKKEKLLPLDRARLPLSNCGSLVATNCAQKIKFPAFLGVMHRILSISATALSVATFHFKSHWANPTIALILVLIPIAMITIFVFLFPILEYFEKKSHLSQHDMVCFSPI